MNGLGFEPMTLAGSSEMRTFGSEFKLGADINDGARRELDFPLTMTADYDCEAPWMVPELTRMCWCPRCWCDLSTLDSTLDGPMYANDAGGCMTYKCVSKMVKVVFHVSEGRASICDIAGCILPHLARGLRC